MALASVTEKSRLRVYTPTVASLYSPFSLVFSKSTVVKTVNKRVDRREENNFAWKGGGKDFVSDVR